MKSRAWLPYVVAAAVLLQWDFGFSACGLADERGADHLPSDAELTVPP